MEKDFQRTPFQKALLTGVFVGFAATIICLVYNVAYRESTGFTPSILINVSSLIFAINILFVLIGMTYYAFIKALPKGEFLFIGLSILITVFCLFKAENAHRSDDYTVNVQFRGLLAGIIFIVGLGACFFLPLLFHNKKFEDNVL